jgi:hypothetical protein
MGLSASHPCARKKRKGEAPGKLNGELRTSASAIAVASAKPYKVHTLADFYADPPVKARLTGRIEPLAVD